MRIANHRLAGEMPGTGADVLYILPKPDFFSRGRRGRVTHAIGVASGLAGNGLNVVVFSGTGTRTFAREFGDGVRIEEVNPPRGRSWFREMIGRVTAHLQGDSSLRHVIVRYAVSNGARFQRLIRSFPDRRWTFEVNSLAYHHYRRLPPTFRRIVLMRELRTLRAADALYVVSESLRNDLLAAASERIDARRILVVPNAGNVQLAHLAATADRAASPARNGGKFVYLGVFHEYYDFEFVLKAFRRLVVERPMAELHFYGDGERLKSVRMMANGTPNTRFHGRYELTEMVRRGEIGSDWIFLLPYRPVPIAGVGSPTKLFEYMALGRPILASALGQLPSIIRDGRTGLIYDPERVDDLVEKMRRLFNHPELRCRIGGAAREEFLSEHTWPKRMAGFWEQLRNLP